MATGKGDKHLLITVWMMPFPMTGLTAAMAAGEESIANMVALLADLQVKFQVSRANQWKLCANTPFFLQRVEYLFGASGIGKLCQGHFMRCPFSSRFRIFQDGPQEKPLAK